ncbi:MAG: hypothetical protein QF464_17840, partial [Myxococcota bacterium]|nr:hypothetical protein [Myxococcota bacterium]
AECVALEPGFDPALNALNSASLEGRFGAAARVALCSAYRSLEQWPDLRDMLEKRLEHEDAPIADEDLHGELAGLYLDRLTDSDLAWRHARASYEDRALETELLPRQEVLLRAGLGSEQTDDLVSLLVEGARRVEDSDSRAAQVAAGALTLASEGWDDDALEALWRVVVDSNPEHGDALQRLEAVVRATNRPEELADLLTHRMAQAEDDTTRLTFTRERGKLLADCTGRELDAIGCLDQFGDDPELDDVMNDLYRRAESWGPLADLLTRRLARAQSDDLSARLKRDLGVVSWRHLDDRAGAAELFGELLRAVPDDTETLSHLEGMWGEGIDREPLLRILEPHYDARQDWDRLVALYRSTLDDDAQAQMHVECLEKVARIQVDRLEDPEGAYDTMKALLSRVEAPETRAAEIEALAERDGRWNDLADFYEQLVVEGHGGPPFLAHLAAVCRDRLSDPTRAIRMFELAASRDPDDPSYDDSLESLLTA